MANTIEYGQGAVNNTIGWGQGAKVGSSFSNTLSTRFDGVDDFVDIGQISEINSASSLSISYWAKKASATGDDMTVGSQVASTNGIWLQWFTDNNVYFSPRNGGFTNVSAFLSGDTNWHHLVGVYDGTNMTIYIDGSQAATSTTSVPTSLSATSGDNFQIGALNGGFFTSGGIDEVAVFDTALTQSDITAIYGSGAPTDLSSYSSLISWWRMGDGDTFPTLTDNKGSNNGTMTNMTSGNIITDVPT